MRISKKVENKYPLKISSILKAKHSNHSLSFLVSFLHQPQNLVGAYCTYQFDRIAALVKDRVDLDLKGGLRRMSVQKRRREDLPEFPDSQLWRIPEFVNDVREMLAMEPPKAPEEVINDFGDDYEADPIATAPTSMNIGPKSGDACAPPPPSGSASHGGPVYPISAEEAEMASQLRIKRMKLEAAEIDERLDKLTKKAPSSVPAADSGGSSRSGMSYNKVRTWVGWLSLFQQTNCETKTCLEIKV